MAEKIRLRKHAQEGRQGSLTPEERLQAEFLDQRCTEKPKKGEFKTLSPFTDEKGIIRVGGRLDKAIVSYETKHPALLPSSHASIRPSKSGYYNRQDNAAVDWILKGNKLSKSVHVISCCVLCREMAHKTEEQLMADLPDLRLAPHTPPFFYTSCDYFGPYNVKIGRTKQMKHYGVTCLNTRAVHLELAVDLSTMGVHASLAEMFLHSRSSSAHEE